MKGYPSVGASAVVTLLSAGAEPRKQLRYVIPATQKARIDLAMNVSIASSTTEGKVVSKKVRRMPTMKATADLVVTSVAPNGDIAYDLTFAGMTLGAGAGADPENRGLQPVVDMMSSVKGSATVSSSGVTTSTRLDVAHPALRTLLGQVSGSIETLVVPFPDVAVGVGARWDVRQARAGGGLTIFQPVVFQRTEYEVVSIDGSTVVLKLKTEETAPPQPLGDPGLPVSNQGIAFGAENRLQKLSGSSTGTVVVHLDSLVPVSERQSTTSMALTMSMNRQAASLALVGDARITIAPPGMAPVTTPDLKSLRGITAVNLGGTHDSRVGPDRRCYPRSADDPRGDFAGVSIAMGGLLSAATDVLKAGGIETSPRTTDFLSIDAQIHDAAECAATISLDLRRGLGKADQRFTRDGKLITGYDPSPVVWRRTFEITGAPAGFSDRVIARFKLDVGEFVSDVAKARALTTR